MANQRSDPADPCPPRARLLLGFRVVLQLGFESGLDCFHGDEEEAAAGLWLSVKSENLRDKTHVACFSCLLANSSIDCPRGQTMFCPSLVSQHRIRLD